MRSGPILPTLMLATLGTLGAGAGGAASRPVIPEMASPPDPLTQPLPHLRRALPAIVNDLSVEERIVPRLWQRIQTSHPEERIPVIVVLVEPLGDYRDWTPDEAEEERLAVTAHLTRELADRALHAGLEGIRALRQFPILLGEIEAARIPVLAADPLVRSIEDEIELHSMRTEGKAMLEVEAARNSFKVTGAGVNVAFIDTGIFPHTEFAGRIKAQANTSGSPGSGIVDRNGHGTAVAGIAAGANGQGLGRLELSSRRRESL